ncbi:MAG TPA: hypothetical protein VEA69_05210 [Tepidisphaeraceae bacterium]|nr:hypothetical protein [Tepidisphaeraceae bacterium]
MTREQGATVAQLLVDHRLADGPHTSGPPASLLAAVPGTDVLAWNAADGGDARWVFPSGLAMSVPTDPSAYDMRTGERRGIVPGSVNALPVSKWTMAVVIADAYAGVGLSVALVAVSLGWLRAEPWSGRAGRWWCATKVGLALALGWASLHVVAQLTGFHERAWAGGQAFPTAEYLAVRVVIAFAIQVSLPVAAWLVLRTDRVRAYWDAGSGAAAPATGARVREGGAWGPRVAATLLWVATVAHVALVPNQSSARGVGGVLLNVCGAMTCAWLAVHAMRTGRRAGAGGTRVAGLSFVCLVAAMGGGPGWAAGPSGAEANGAPDPAVIGAMVGRWTAAPDPAAARRAMEDDARRHPAETTLALYDAIATREFRVAVPAAEMMARGRPRGVVTAPIPAALLDERMKAARPALLDMYLKAPTPDDAYALLELARLRPGLVDYSAAVIGDAITGSEADQARKLVWVATRAKPTEEEREQIRRVAREATWSQLPRVAEVGNRCSAYGGWIGMITAREILFADARAGEVAARAAAVAARAEAQAAAETARRNTAFRTTVRTALGPIVAGLESADPAARTVALDKLAALTPEVFHRAPADRVAVLTGDPDPEVARRARAVLGRMRVGGDWTPDNVPADVGLAWARASDREVRTEPGELLANVLSTVATVGLWAGGAIVVAGRVGRTRRAGRDDGRAGHPRVAGERPA